MRLTRKAVYHLGIASQIFHNESSKDETLPIESRKLNVNVTARMFIKKNAKEVAEMFEMIKDEEKNIAEKNFGYMIGVLGYMQFFEGPEQLESFKSQEEEFASELQKLQEMSKGLPANDKEAIVQINRDFDVIRRKYVKSGDEKKSQLNLQQYNKDFNDFMEDKEGEMDFKVQKIKAIWFENTDSLPQAFGDHYDDAGLLSYEE